MNEAVDTKVHKRPSKLERIPCPKGTIIYLAFAIFVTISVFRESDIEQSEIVLTVFMMVGAVVMLYGPFLLVWGFGIFVLRCMGIGVPATINMIGSLDRLSRGDTDGMEEESPDKN